jgi:hypothetical protein
MSMVVGHDADLPHGLPETPVSCRDPGASLIRRAEQRPEPLVSPRSQRIPKEIPLPGVKVPIPRRPL